MISACLSILAEKAPLFDAAKIIKRLEVRGER
jgi:hypothetical protein